MKISQKQSGSAHIIIIVILVIVIIGLLGFVFWQNLTKSTKSDSTTSTTTSKSTTSTPTQTSTDRLQDFYSKYLTDVEGLNGGGTPNDEIAKYKTAGYIADDFTSTGGDGEPITCGGVEGYPDSVKVVLKASDETTASLNVTKVYNDTSTGADGKGDVSAYTIDVAMTVGGSNEWQIHTINCAKN